MKSKYKVYVNYKTVYYGNDLSVAEKLFNDNAGFYWKVKLFENGRIVREYFPL
jgi:hypothetical protein